MKLILLGATGNTGIQLAIQACQRGHEVTALVRNPEKLKNINDKNLKVVKCNLLDVNELTKQFAGHDAILSSLGSPGLTCSRITFPLDSMKVIVSAMRSNKLKRLILVSSQYTKPNLSTYPKFLYKIILRAMIGRQLDALYEMEEYLLNECNNDIDFTIVRPPRLTDDALSATKEIAVEDKYHIDDGSGLVRMSRANVARFMLDILVSNEYLKKGISVDMPKK